MPYVPPIRAALRPDRASCGRTTIPSKSTFFYSGEKENERGQDNRKNQAGRVEGALSLNRKFGRKSRSAAPAAPTGSPLKEMPISGVGISASALVAFPRIVRRRSSEVNPRKPGTRPGFRSDKAPLRSSLWSGRPSNHLFQRGWRLYPGGRAVLVSRKPSTQQSSIVPSGRRQLDAAVASF